jgi:hypothetical protein
MSLRNGKNNQSTTSQTSTESTGTQSNEKQSDTLVLLLVLLSAFRVRSVCVGIL